ncbi:hypothetical protein [Paenibacillus sp. MSJ-34]|uniref:hypothetical protein n=1 Tax=Paenibacillus sp. MSJ-34 TaxID=2841529 RepID=UPI001C121A15|nr:hypothetical protein [Paenibacillus sp. MSJ-34]MBU5442214.1 hypothetical protein [Paenibacillus sp. MSJ-34]
MTDRPFFHGKAKRVALVSLVAAVAASFIFVAFFLIKPVSGSFQQGDEGDLLTIDGFGVSEQEFLLFLYDERALTANTFYQQYGADADSDFWDRKFDGQTPLEYARNSALDKLLTAKMEAIVAVEQGLIGKDIRFSSIMNERERTNAERERMLKDGEVFYGLSSFDEYQYYNYIRNHVWSELVKWYSNKTKVTDEELYPVYEANKDLFTLGVELTYMMLRQDGSTEILTQTENDIPKGDTQALDIWYELKELEPGQKRSEVEYKGEVVDVLLMSKKEMGDKPFSDAKPLLLQIYAEDQLRLLVKERVESANISIDRQKFNAIRF